VSTEEREVVHRLAHALRTPIAVIQGFAELLLRDENGDLTPQQRVDYAERIRGAAGDMRVALDETIQGVDASDAD
jgi:signal transduction histidine kinase